MASGLLFGAGLVLADMVNPARVRAFLDVTGAWDPTLGYVMGAALAVASAATLVARAVTRPLLETKFLVVEEARVDIRLLVGAAAFGIGWGLVGLCPGPAVADLALGGWQSWLFVASMTAGMVLDAVIRRAWAPADVSPA